MLKKTMTYEDFDGNKRTEDFFFNLTKAECAEMEFGVDGGLTAMLNKISSERNLPRIIEIIKEIIIKAYGVKSPDGRRFIKNDEVRESFAQTNAYSDLFMELAFDANKCAKFVQGIVGVSDEDLAAAKAEVEKQLGVQFPEDVVVNEANITPIN